MSMFERKASAVVMMDALGAAKFSPEQAKKFILTRDHLVRAYEEQKRVATLQSLQGGLLTVDQAQVELNQITPYPYHFQDTVILTFGRSFTALETLYFNRWIGAHLVEWLSYGIMMRGALAVGDFIEDCSSTVLGSAVAEAATYYESPQYISFLLTDSYSNQLDSIIQKGDSLAEAIRPFYIKYESPLKCKDGNKITKPMWNVNWVQNLYFGLTMGGQVVDKDTIRGEIAGLLKGCNCDASKSQATIEFCEVCLDALVEISLEDMLRQEKSVRSH